MSASNTSPVPVTSYQLPRGLNAAGALLPATLMLLSASRTFIEPGSFVYDRLITQSATLIKHRHTIQDVLFYVIYGMHTIGTLVFMAKLEKHRVKRFSVLWVQWVLTSFSGGSFGLNQFDEVVKQTEGAGKSS